LVFAILLVSIASSANEKYRDCPVDMLVVEILVDDEEEEVDEYISGRAPDHV
jgi:hypothetical protein